MTRDRLQEFQRTKDGTTENSAELQQDRAIQIERDKTQGTEKFEDSLQKIQSAYGNIRVIKENTEKLKELHEAVLQEYRHSETTMQDIDTCKSRVRSAAKTVRRFIEDANKESPQTTMEERILKTQANTLRGLLWKAMEDYSNELSYYEKMTRKVLVRQLRIKTNNENVNYEEEEALIKEISNVFTENYLHTARQERDNLDELNFRHNELIKIEKSIVEVQSNFIELFNIVSTQGETIDRIEDYISAAADLTQKGRVDIEKAKNSKTKSRKKKIWIISIFIFLLLLLVMIAAIMMVSQE